MRILLPTATIVASFTTTTIVTAAEATTFNQQQRDAAATSAANDKSTKKLIQVTHDVNKSYQETSNLLRKQQQRRRECNTHIAVKTSGADLGVLGCVGVDETCEPNDTSKLGGRCTTTSKESNTMEDDEENNKAEIVERTTTTPEVAAFPARRYRPKIFAELSRNLQVQEGEGSATGDNTTEDVDPFVCPTGCPQSFCDCAEADGDAQKCAPELHAVCEQNLLPACVPDKYLTFYTETYCPFSACLAVENQPYEVCSCGYYSSYCQVYYSYEQSIDKCAVGECCDGLPVGEKFQCIPALQPTMTPTDSPTVTAPPSDSPTVSYSL